MARQYRITNEPERIDFELDEKSGNDPIERAVQNAKNLIMVRMGEIPYDRTRGFNTALYDRTIAEMREMLTEELDRVLLWEPYAEVVSAEILRSDENGTIFEVIIEISENVK